MSVLDHVLAVVPVVISVASLVANVISPASVVGRVVFWLAMNGPAIQSAVKAASDAVKSADADTDGRPKDSGGL